MTSMESVDEILEFAIEKEEEAAAFYQDLAGRMDKPWMADLFKSFALEEKGHQAKLTSVKQGRRFMPVSDKIQDLKIADYLVDVEPTPNMGFQEALILAMKREKASFKLYTDLAEATDNENLRSTFESLAQEEAKHKLRIEIEYDNIVLTDN